MLRRTDVRILLAAAAWTVYVWGSRIIDILANDEDRVDRLHRRPRGPGGGLRRLRGRDHPDRAARERVPWPPAGTPEPERERRMETSPFRG